MRFGRTTKLVPTDLLAAAATMSRAMPDRTGVEHAEQVGAGGMAPAVPCDAIGCDRSSCKGGRSVTLMAGQSAVFSRCGCAGESGNRLTADSWRGVLAILQGEEQDGLVPAWQMGERAVLGEHDAAGDQRLRAHRTDRTAHLRRLQHRAATSIARQQQSPATSRGAPATWPHRRDSAGRRAPSAFSPSIG